MRTYILEVGRIDGRRHRALRGIDEPRHQLALQHYEHLSEHDLIETIIDLQAELARRRDA
jgi:hypothetical protein